MLRGLLDSEHLRINSLGRQDRARHMGTLIPGTLIPGRCHLKGDLQSPLGKKSLLVLV